MCIRGNGLWGNAPRGNVIRGNGPRGNGPRGNDHTGKRTQSRAFITRHFFEGNLGILVFFDFLYILRIFGNSRFSTDCFLSDL
jgi:hypothetical protein